MDAKYMLELLYFLMEVNADVSKYICIHIVGMHRKEKDTGLDGCCCTWEWCKYTEKSGVQACCITFSRYLVLASIIYQSFCYTFLFRKVAENNTRFNLPLFLAYAKITNSAHNLFVNHPWCTSINHICQIFRH